MPISRISGISGTTFYMTYEQKATLKKWAKANGMTIQDYIITKLKLNRRHEVLDDYEVDLMIEKRLNQDISWDALGIHSRKIKEQINAMIKKRGFKVSLKKENGRWKSEYVHIE